MPTSLSTENPNKCDYEQHAQALRHLVGFAAPATVRGRILMRQLTSKVNWIETRMTNKHDWTVCDNNDTVQLSRLTVPWYVGSLMTKSARLSGYPLMRLAFRMVLCRLRINTKTKTDKNEWNIMHGRAEEMTEEMLIPRLWSWSMFWCSSRGIYPKSLSVTTNVYIWSYFKCVLQWIKSRKVQGPFNESKLKGIRSTICLVRAN